MRPFAVRLSSPLLEDHDHAECGGAWGVMTNQLRRSRWQQLRYSSECNNSRGTSSSEGWLTMGDKTSERKGLLWWIEHESTNEFWSLKNPWVVGPLVLLVAIVLCALATFFWGMPRVVADVITKVAVFGYLLVLFIYQVRAKRRVAAIGTAIIALILAI